jgi:hypothetical protein
MDNPSIVTPPTTTSHETSAIAVRVDSHPRPRVARAILLGGFIAGTLDILDALTFQWAMGRVPVRVLYYIASGVMGRQAAYAGGSRAAALGLMLHFVIAYSATTIYVLASLRLPVLVRRAVLCGMGYGLVVQAVMQFIVLPLAGFPGGLPTGVSLINLTAAHLFCVGVPIALATKRAARIPPPVGR